MEQTAINLHIKRLEKESILAQVELLELASELCDARREQITIDLNRIRAKIDENLARAVQAQEDVNGSRELHGRTVVFPDAPANGDDDEVEWDPSAEASSSVVADEADEPEA